MSTQISLRIHWVRHGKVASHHGDISLTDDGLQQAEVVGKQLSEGVSADEQIFFFYAPTRRTRETAEAIHRSMDRELVARNMLNVQLFAPIEHAMLRNPDLYVGGRRVELVSSAQAMAEQTLPFGIDVERLLKIPFLRNFWNEEDRIGYWVNHTDPPGEDAYAVARRVLTFAASLLDLPHTSPCCYICVTHSPVMRAFMRYFLQGQDPGEPEYGESLDMSFADNGSLMLHFRDVNVTRP